MLPPNKHNNYAHCHSLICCCFRRENAIALKQCKCDAVMKKNQMQYQRQTSSSPDAPFSTCSRIDNLNSVLHSFGRKMELNVTKSRKPQKKSYGQNRPVTSKNVQKKKRVTDICTQTEKHQETVIKQIINFNNKAVAFLSPNPVQALHAENGNETSKPETDIASITTPVGNRTEDCLAEKNGNFQLPYNVYSPPVVNSMQVTLDNAQHPGMLAETAVN